MSSSSSVAGPDRGSPLSPLPPPPPLPPAACRLLAPLASAISPPPRVRFSSSPGCCHTPPPCCRLARGAGAAAARQQQPAPPGANRRRGRAGGGGGGGRAQRGDFAGPGQQLQGLQWPGGAAGGAGASRGGGARGAHRLVSPAAALEPERSGTQVQLEVGCRAPHPSYAAGWQRPPHVLMLAAAAAGGATRPACDTGPTGGARCSRGPRVRPRRGRAQSSLCSHRGVGQGEGGRPPTSPVACCLRGGAATHSRGRPPSLAHPAPAVDWYLERVATAVEAAKRATDGAPITLLCHSAGGWLGRCARLLLLCRALRPCTAAASAAETKPDAILLEICPSNSSPQCSTVTACRPACRACARPLPCDPAQALPPP